MGDKIWIGPLKLVGKIEVGDLWQAHKKFVEYNYYLEIVEVEDGKKYMVDIILYLVVQRDILPYVLGLNRIENYSSVLMLDSLKTCWNVE